MAISLGGRLLGPSSGLPGSRDGPDRPAGSTGRTGRRPIRCSLLDLAPGGVCLAKPVARPAGELLPHRFTLTARSHRACPAAAPRGGLLSVALSLASRPVGVTHRHVLRSPDFPPGVAACWADVAAHGSSTGGHPARSEPFLTIQRTAHGRKWRRGGTHRAVPPRGPPPTPAVMAGWPPIGGVASPGYAPTGAASKEERVLRPRLYCDLYTPVVEKCRGRTVSP